jgi:hypothetical protein
MRMAFPWENNDQPIKLIFDVTPIPTDRTWGFRFTLEDGTSDLVSGFTNEAEARTWLSSERCDQWLKSQGYARDNS